MELNNNNLQTAFNYKPTSNEYNFNTISNTVTLNSDAIYLKYFEGEDLFCVDLGYSIDGDVSKMTFTINDLTVYPVVLTTVDKLSAQTINEQEIYLISDDINFKSIIFIPKVHLNKTFKYTITSINTTFSSFMLDEIGRKFNSSSIATEASQVSQDNSNGLGDNVQVALNTIKEKNDNVQVALNTIKEKNDNLQNQINIIVNEKIPDIYDYSGKETLTNKIAIVNGVRKQVYRKCKEADYQFIQDGVYHLVDIFEIPKPSLITSLKGRVRRKPNEFTYSLNYYDVGYGVINMVTYANAKLSIEYVLNTGRPSFVNHYVVEIEYVK